MVKNLFGEKPGHIYVSSRVLRIFFITPFVCFSYSCSARPKEFIKCSSHERYSTDCVDIRPWDELYDEPIHEEYDEPITQPMCEVTFSTKVILQPFVIESARRWSRVTSCNIYLNEEGIPIHLVDEPMFNNEGIRVAGRTRILLYENQNYIASEIFIDRAWLPDPERLLFFITHEMGHALAPSQTHRYGRSYERSGKPRFSKYYRIIKPGTDLFRPSMRYHDS